MTQKTMPRMEHRFAFYEYERIDLLNAMALEVKALAVLFDEEFLVVETEARLRRANGLVIHRSVNCNRALRT